MSGKFAILMDGGFIKKKIQERTKNFPSAADIDAEVSRLKAHPALVGHFLLRFARREGVRVYLDHMGHATRRELKVHADLVI